MTQDIEHIIKRFERKKGRLISVILPVFNEEDALPAVLDELFAYARTDLPDYTLEVMFIDDASRDQSSRVILERRALAPPNVRVSVCRLARNSGGHVAITAGLNLARGDFTILMASDGQDPPAVIGQLIAGWREGFNVVLAARSTNLDQTPFRRGFSWMAWKIMGWSTGLAVPEKGCDMLGIDRCALDAFNRMDERNTTFIFRIFSLGFRRKQIDYVKRARMGGRSSWNFRKKIHILLDAMTGYSSRPLKMITTMGMAIFVVLVFRWLHVVFKIYVLGHAAADLTIILNTIFTSLAVVVLLLGMIGDYLWRILDETRKRPLYEIEDFKGDLFRHPENPAQGTRS